MLYKFYTWYIFQLLILPDVERSAKRFISDRGLAERHVLVSLILLGYQSRLRETVRTSLGSMSLALPGKIGCWGGWGLTLHCNIWALHPAAKRAYRQLFSSETGRDIDGVNWQSTYTHAHTRWQSSSLPRWPNLHSCDRSPTLYLNAYVHKYVYRETPKNFREWKHSLRSGMLAPGN